MSIDLHIVNWRSSDARQRALDLAKAQRAATGTTPSFDDDAWLEVLDAAIAKAVVETHLPDDFTIDAQVQFHDDPTGSWQVNIWFRVYPPAPEPEVEVQSITTGDVGVLDVADVPGEIAQE